MFALSQGALWQAAQGRVARPAAEDGARPQPSYVNPAVTEGPLGEEDQTNFHP
jgi:hypothetical protein